MATFPNDWRRQCSLTIPNAKVSGSSNFSNFPVLLTHTDLPDEVLDSDDTNGPQSNGYDIRFSSDAAGVTPLPFEIGYFARNSNPTLARAELWIKIPTLTWDTDTTIYMWWNPIGTETVNPSSASSVFSDYEFVSHDGGNTDVTGNYTMTVTGTISKITNHFGIPSRASEFDGGSTERYSTAISSTFDLDAQDVTMQCWMNKNAVDGMQGRVFIWHTATPDESIQLVANAGGGEQNLTFVSRASGHESPRRQIVSDNTWVYVSCVSNPSGGFGVATSLYVDTDVTDAASGTGWGDGTAEDIFVVGARQDASTSNDFEGDIGEVRVRLSELPSSWHLTEYNNQVNDGTFWTTGTPNNVIGITSLDTVPSININTINDVSGGLITGINGVPV